MNKQPQITKWLAGVVALVALIGFALTADAHHEKKKKPVEGSRTLSVDSRN